MTRIVLVREPNRDDKDGKDCPRRHKAESGPHGSGGSFLEEKGMAGVEGEVSWTRGEKSHTDGYVTRRSFETNVSTREEKFKSSTDVRPQTNTNNTGFGHNSLERGVD